MKFRRWSQLYEYDGDGNNTILFEQITNFLICFPFPVDILLHPYAVFILRWLRTTSVTMLTKYAE